MNMKRKTSSQTRRDFIAKSALVASGLSVGAPYVSSAKHRILGANEKIRIGFIGVGNRGTKLLHLFMQNENVEIAALCDVYKPYTERDKNLVASRYLDIGKVPNMGENFSNKVAKFTDFRKMLEMKDLDAVCIATPDHWHAIQTIQSIQAGLDVYVEKPLTNTIKEGRAMIDAEKNSKQVVAVGLNRRGSSVYSKLHQVIQDDGIGRVTTARAMRISNMAPNGIGNLKPEAPPKDFDWDMWLGPRAKRPYQYNIAPYFFRWWEDYSSQMGNWGVHYMDVIRWMLNETAPKAITAHGGKYALTDDRTIPDTMEVLFEFESGRIVQFSIHEASAGKGIPNGEIELRGTKGTVYASQNGYQIQPSWPGQFQKWDKKIEVQDVKVESMKQFGDLNIKEDTTANLVKNFVDCIKSRETPLCTLEDGHRSTSFAHLANIALKMGTRIEWDAQNEKITNIEKANDLLHYEYRNPWTLS